MRIIQTALCGAFILLSGCAEKGAGPLISAGERYVAGPDAAGNDAVAGYRMGEGDKVKVTVFNEPTLSGEFTIGAEGTLALPLIGAVPAKGRTIDQVTEDARARFADGYLRMPKVSAEITLYRPFYILGEVAAPGLYPYSIGLTALNAVATAKGFTPRASRDTVQIRRQGEAAEASYRLTPELLVYPGDTIRVGERYF